MFYCRLCNFKTPSLPRHLLHHKFHRNIHNYVHCGFEKCLKFFKKEAHLKKHLFRSHNLLKQKENPKTVLNSDQRGKFVCSISSCEKEWDCFSDLVKHLKVHIKKNDQITCPMHDCGKKYKVLSSFTSHLTKQHRNNYKKVQDSKIYDQSEIEESQTNSDSVEAQSLECVVDNENQSERFEIDGNAQSESPVELNPSLEESSDLYLHNLAQFYLKLETQLLLSASTVKTIVTEITSMQRESQNIVMTSLARKLISEGISADKVDIIVKEIINEDPFLKCNVKLGSNYKRKKFYKENFDFIQPESLVIDKENQTYFSYVPIIETLKYTFQDKSIQHEILKKPEPRDKDVLFDFMDGTVYKCNTFFNDNPDALKIILYQDAFEVVNPIGAAKKKHKILAVYMSIENLPENLRSHVNTIKLVALCNEIDFDCQKVYGKIVEDLKIIETTGIEVGECILTTWKNSLEKKVKPIRQYLKTCHTLKINKSQELKNIIQDCKEATETRKDNYPKNAIIFPLLVLYFEENIELLYNIVDSALNEDAILETCANNNHPVLIIRGKTLYDSESTCTIILEGKTVIYCSDFLDGILLTFLSYYIFGYKYPAGLEKTLEFIQRILLQINPPIGTKTAPGKKRRTKSYNSAVFSLAKALSNFSDSFKTT
ncbi:uncharacterized protein LOC103315333 [Nasonia vitripennis]|uniref:C2H2-type domain-containing protein n=1 Tax=Nasonia vitripennis TaxID=7425 RepID=A0A7M7QJV2_NASVI|nr:uncharacterized protein LOC103315333 [Nasonia vitripennis]XP_031787690.1 uncharacterized protein LOC103315333 [Nasonia vitripennis]XP_031787691.1 uncharacterized protein LOC103315333 [Nasonia vitripennis]